MLSPLPNSVPALAYHRGNVLFKRKVQIVPHNNLFVLIWRGREGELAASKRKMEENGQAKKTKGARTAKTLVKTDN